MRNLIIATIASLLCAGIACAQGYTIQSDRSAQVDDQAQEEKNLEILSKRLVRMKKEMDKFVKEMSAAYKDDAAGPTSTFGGDVKVDIMENKKDVTVRADLPGMDKDKITVTLEKGKFLRIAGSRDVVKSESGPNVVRQERMEGKFERLIELPAECKSDGISAHYQNGVLDIVIPKKEAAQQDSVKVKIQ